MGHVWWLVGRMSDVCMGAWTDMCMEQGLSCDWGCAPVVLPSGVCIPAGWKCRPFAAALSPHTINAFMADGKQSHAFAFVCLPVQPVATLRVNQQTGKPAAEAAEAGGAEAAAPDSDAFFDPGIGARGLKKLNRRARATFEFVHEGEFQRQAELFRCANCVDCTCLLCHAWLHLKVQPSFLSFSRTVTI